MTHGPVDRASLEGDPERPFRSCHCSGDDYVWDPACERCRAAGCGNDVSGACRLRPATADRCYFCVKPGAIMRVIWKDRPPLPCCDWCYLEGERAREAST